MSTSRSNFRYIACEILKSILEFGTNSQEVLHWHLEKSGVSARERSQITAMVYGTLDYLPYLDFCLERQLSKKINRLEPIIRTILRLGAWQILKSYAIPKAVAVTESVKLCSEFKVQYASGLVNAVLRRTEDVKLTKRQQHLNLGIHSEIFGLLRKWYGDAAKQIATSYLHHSEFLNINFNPQHDGELSYLVKSWRDMGIDVETSTYFPQALHIKLNGNQLSRLPGYAEGSFYVQDEATMLPAHIIANYFEQRHCKIRILDLCAGVGGKAIDLAWQLPDADIVVNEPNEHRRNLLYDNLARYGLTLEVHSIEVNADLHLPELFDVILIDAPCSGLGVVRHKPEIKHRLSYEKIQSFPTIQGELLAGAANNLKPGGILLYATCTLNPDENQNLSTKLLAREDFSPLDLTDIIPQTLKVDLSNYHDDGVDLKSGRILLRPDYLSTDGFFIQVVRKDGKNN